MGASGYTGSETLRILLKHPKMTPRIINLRNKAGDTVLHVCIRRGIKFTKRLVDDPRTDINLLSPAGTTPLVMLLKMWTEMRLPTADEHAFCLIMTLLNRKDVDLTLPGNDLSFILDLVRNYMRYLIQTEYNDIYMLYMHRILAKLTEIQSRC